MQASSVITSRLAAVNIRGRSRVGDASYVSHALTYSADGPYACSECGIGTFLAGNWENTEFPEPQRTLSMDFWFAKY